MRECRNSLARFSRDELIGSFYCVFIMGCEPTAHGNLPEESEVQSLPVHLCDEERAARTASRNVQRKVLSILPPVLIDGRRTQFFPFLFLLI